MQRVRMSLPFYKDCGWEAEVVCVKEKYTDAVFDHLLSESIPKDIKIHYVNAFSKKWTSKFGLGSIALRSLFFYKTFVNKLLKKQKYDLIFFSTTQFPVCILGAYWKKKFNIPYIIDFQDPWFSDYYEDKPKFKRPKKYWFSYRLDKYLEPIAVKNVAGLMAVSQNYIDDLRYRYPHLNKIPAAVITFGGFNEDLKIASEHFEKLRIAFDNDPKYKHLVYVGRGGYDMQKSVGILLSAFKQGLEENFEIFSQIRFHFIGTSYAPLGQGDKTLFSVAEKLAVGGYVHEQTDRISFYESIYNLQCADALFIPGHEQAAYTASKIYPYILCEKPILAIFNVESSAAKTIMACNAGVVIDINSAGEEILKIQSFLTSLVSENIQPAETDWEQFEEFRAKPRTTQQCSFFNICIGI
ncbi:hypothetical protein EZ449_14375 [Pedobacter frigidisoli]|uniref:Uncharacterized protein n=2 Tax=Pedobacter frigidisoli TaxID=2530455 RepID=A0A4R0NZU0_9SPHI|nr:hypothetical protein EZ449_14375 [Pedobacter frigidisoli]